MLWRIRIFSRDVRDESPVYILHTIRSHMQGRKESKREKPAAIGSGNRSRAPYVILRLVIFIYSQCDQ